MISLVKYDLEKIPIVDLANKIIIAAVKSQASDIHMDPIENGLKIRFRVDGDLQDHTIIPREFERNLTTRIKLISNMNITETRLPQDGAIKGRIDGNDLDMRVSVLPTNEGEKVVIRILDYTRSLSGLKNLNFAHENFKKISRMLMVPSGIILVTGATGSGKSTTTYSMLEALNKEETNIITVEDPVEMNLEGVNQVQVNSDIGMTFAAALRSILRQDPNVILIGEIRDGETAQIAVRASITGHLVLSTIHTNTALSTIERLLDMDVERYLLSTALEGIIAQKLARLLCNHCKILRPTTPYEKKIFKQVLNKDVPEVYDANNDPNHHCKYCRNGFKGRLAIHEVLLLDQEVRDAINNPNLEKEDLRKMVYNGKTIMMLQDGLAKVIEGYTSFEEIYKLIEIEESESFFDLEQVNEEKHKNQEENKEEQ